MLIEFLNGKKLNVEKVALLQRRLKKIGFRYHIDFFNNIFFDMEYKSERLCVAFFADKGFFNYTILTYKF